MIKLIEIRQPIIKGLRGYTGATTITAETTAKQPEYPFIALKFTTAGQSVGQVAETVEGYATGVIEQDLELVVSITCHAKDISEAHDLSHKARAYFLGKGNIDLSDVNITIVEALAITNRDVFLNIEYERRYGFDVRLRVRGRESFDIDVIESIDATGTIEKIEIKEGI
ncbi:LIC_12616 family protein [Lysinibacillus sphaericus]|uniref:phage neck terminator protein n=1 Tax=Lysinibacillus sphaericus TaxID=1421 RepID=UPI003811D985